MKHTYQVNGMSCSGCSNHVESALSNVEGVVSAKVDLQKGEAVIEMKSHIPIEKFQEALKSSGGNYSIALPGNDTHNHDVKVDQPNNQEISKQKKKGSGVFYCPMHCEGEKTYDKQGNCPVCGMDLVEQPSSHNPTEYTCPMHPEIIRDEAGVCPICGMDLVPIAAKDEVEDKTYKNLLRKFKIACVFTLPIFIITMTEMLPNNPLFKILDLKYWNWVQLVLSIPVVFYAAWMFFERAWRSVVSWNLNMFTLIGIGSGVAWLFSITALFFPNIFPDQFKTEHGTVYV